ncbi:prepilin-type N-terminal cleavage/methylation domain-containing protein [Paenibacillus lemnae]|uniref:Prepilin-type N-terminal cleavage/methylation domain-containing protein n=1 Tax=Paenibacillus lemnae TaxID=1330551 RepID=A0A848M7M7_PAELE|nr:prepilin-type N-terminal cleavage/methylation domain-containing protein [Paenibacillus lemnae]NMO96665.1 prepilin-type N-terminal cleavage/methylation domain-containing protein [Paenibacillus lemnae]
MLSRALKARQARLQDEKGFTLIELLAVIVILGIIAIIAIPLIGNIIDNSKKDADVATARQLYDAARLYVIGEKNGDFKHDDVKSGVELKDLQDEKYLETTVALPSTKEPLTDATVTFDVNGKLEKVELSTSTVTDKEFLAEKVLTSERE